MLGVTAAEFMERENLEQEVVEADSSQIEHGKHARDRTSDYLPSAGNRGLETSCIAVMSVPATGLTAARPPYKPCCWLQLPHPVA